jgi:hypothetical protein
MAVVLHILIPNADNNKKLFPPELDTQFRDELDRLFGGSSVPPGLIAGQWVDAGQTYFDSNRSFVVFIKEGLLKQAADILAAVEFAKTHYGQLAITVMYLSQAEIL